MTIGDIVIIYLALGAPLSVYCYLQNRRLATGSRLGVSILTLLFWIPAALRLAYRSSTNAYSTDHFVSSENLDASDVPLAELREKIRRQLLHANPRSLPQNDHRREVLERYVGLSAASELEPSQMDEPSLDLFTAAGREDARLGSICLRRRNQRSIERHHTRARRDFLSLFEHAAGGDPELAERAIESGLELVRHLDDKKAVDGLEILAAQITDEVWIPEIQSPVLGSISAQVSPMTMKTAPLNND